MRFIDRRNCKSAFEKGESHEIKSMGALTQEAVKIAEQNGLGVMQNRSGAFRVIRACGLGAYENFFSRRRICPDRWRAGCGAWDHQQSDRRTFSCSRAAAPFRPSE